MGKTDKNVAYIVLPYGQDIEEYQRKIEAEVEAAKDDGILILTDLFGGSPFMVTSRVYEKYHTKVAMEIVCGMNLPMVAEVISAMNLDGTLSELKKTAIEAGHQGIVDFTERLQSIS